MTNTTNNYAKASITLAFISVFLWELGIVPIITIILSVIALVKIQKTNESGKTIAFIGLVVGVIFLVVSINQIQKDSIVTSNIQTSETIAKRPTNNTVINTNNKPQVVAPTTEQAKINYSEYLDQAVAIQERVQIDFLQKKKTLQIETYELDAVNEIIIFTSTDGTRYRANVEYLGSFTPTSAELGSWQWSWADKTVVRNWTKFAENIQKFGSENDASIRVTKGLYENNYLTTPHFNMLKDDIYEFISIALKLNGGIGEYNMNFNNNGKINTLYFIITSISKM